MNRRFIVTADDYGVSPLIDDAIKATVTLGIVTSVACFANGTDGNDQFTMDSILELEAMNAKPDVGCHFTITSGNWMSKKKSGLGKKNGKNPKFRSRAWQHPERALKKDSGDELVEELSSQVAAFEKAGVEIKHFSDHMGILSYTKRGMEAMITVINNYNETRVVKAPLRNPVFISCVERLDQTCLDKSTMAFRATLGLAIKNLIQRNSWEEIKIEAVKLNDQLRMVHGAGIRTTDYLIESYYANASRQTLQCIQRNAPGARYDISNPISNTDVVSEIMVHLAIGPGNGMTKVDYKAEVKSLRKHGGVAVKYLKNRG